MAAKAKWQQLSYPQKMSPTQTQKPQRARKSRNRKRFLSREPCSKIQARRLGTLTDWCARKTFSALVNRSVLCSAEGSEVETPEWVADISTAIVWIVAVFCSRDRLLGHDKANSALAIGPRHKLTLWIVSRELWVTTERTKQSRCQSWNSHH